MRSERTTRERYGGPAAITGYPCAAAAVGVLAGGAGLMAGRPWRSPALIAGFLLAVACLVSGRLLA